MLALRSLASCFPTTRRLIPHIRTYGSKAEVFSIRFFEYDLHKDMFNDSEHQTFNHSSRHKQLEIAYKVLGLIHPNDQAIVRNLFAHSPSGVYKFRKHSSDLTYGIEINGHFCTPADAVAIDMSTEKDKARMITQRIFSKETTSPKGVTKISIQEENLQDYLPTHYIPAFFQAFDLSTIYSQPNPYPFEVYHEPEECTSTLSIPRVDEKSL